MKRLALVLLALVVAALAVRHILAGRLDVRLGFPAKSRTTVLHDALVPIRLTPRTAAVRLALHRADLRAVVMRQGAVVTTIGRRTSIRLRYDPVSQSWIGRWPVPWNAEDGDYEVRVFGAPVAEEKVQKGVIRVTRRRAPALSDVRVLTMESVLPLGTSIRGPDGRPGDWRGIFDWVAWSGANTYWTMAAETAGYGRRVADDHPWVEYDDATLAKLGQEAHRRGVKFGTWVDAYLTFGTAWKTLTRYRWAIEYQNGALVPTRSVSLGDENRIKDLVSILGRLQRHPDVDHVGVDYMRNALGGYELVDRFVEDMDVDVPSGWPRFTLEERMRWLAREKIARKNMALVDQWQWWRAHVVAGIVRRIRREAHITKPFWAFTLTWEKGWQHGQDPVMLNDAGLDMDALMLYEANREQFNTLMKDWRAYVKRGQVNLVVGNVIDWPLHQKSQNPPGPIEFRNRLLEAVHGIYGDGPAVGAFLHDLSRALWGRRGPYPVTDWMAAGRECLDAVRAEAQARPAPVPVDWRLRLSPAARPWGFLPRPMYLGT